MKYQQAIVIGSGISGLVSARVLADYFNHVTLIDRDQIPTTAMIRKGVPQARHLHTLLPGGLEVLNRLFPDLETTLDNEGGLNAGPAQWYALTSLGKSYRLSRYQPTPLDSEGFQGTRVQTRALLEHSIRQQVEALPNVEVKYNSTVSNPLTENNSITGIRIDQTGEEIYSDLVVDATGRVSKTLGWLKQMDFPLPQESTVNCNFAYTSGVFKATESIDFNDVGFLISSAAKGPYTKRAGSLVRIGKGQFLVTVAGRLGDFPPATQPEFIDYIQTLLHPDLYNMIENAELVGQLHQFRFPKSVLRHYEKLASFPEGLLPIGDALCHVNPGYGQGMSTACRQAAELDKILSKHIKNNEPLTGLWKDYFKAAHEQARAPWLFAAINDFNKEGTTGDFPHQESHVIEKLKEINEQANKGDDSAASLADAVFDMKLPLSAIE